MRTTKIKQIFDNGQLVRIEFEEEIPAPTKSTKKDPFMDKIMKSVSVTNKFTHNVRNALINESQDDFKKLYKQYKAYSKKERVADGKEPESEKDQKISILKIMAADLVEFTNNKEFKEEKALSYLNTLDGKISPRILAFIFAVCGKKDASFAILEKHPSDITAEQYDTFYEVLRIDVYLKNKPFSPTECEEQYNQRKEEFLFAQSRLALHKELSDMPVQKTVTKRAKL
jgi:hypothetical protein